MFCFLSTAAKGAKALAQNSGSDSIDLKRRTSMIEKNILSELAE
jgi:hypothetical protein